MMASKGLTRREAAEFLTEELGLPVAPASLAKMASVSSDGPPYRKFRRRVIYERDELIEWAKARLSGPRRSSSDTGAPK